MKYYRSHVLVCVDPECAGKRRQAHVIDPDICIRCGICMQVCNFNAINVK